MAKKPSVLSKAPAPRSRTSAKPHWPHQKETIAFSRSRPIVYDTSDPGTGKTRPALEVFAERRRKGGKCALVVCPSTLMEAAWGDDIREFAPDMMFSLAMAENRKFAFEIEADFYIINADGVKWLAEVPNPKKFFAKFDTLIIDEITDFKHRTSDRSKAIKKIVKYFKYRTGMTGTPNSNSITDLWHQMLLLDDGKRLGTQFFKFREATQIPEQTGPKATHLTWKDKPGAEEAVSALLSDISIRHEFEVVMTHVPKNHTRSVKYRLPRKLLTQYLELEMNAVLELKDGDVSAINAASLRQKLLQVASGAVYTEEDSYKVLDTGRYKLIMDLVKQVKHSVVFFNWTHQKEQLVKEAEKRGHRYVVIDGTTPKRERAEIRRAYQRGEYDVAFLHPATGAHGLTLTKGTRTIWCSPNDRADFLKQGKHRIYRGDQSKPTETIMVEAEDTLEAKVYSNTNAKTGRMVNFLGLLRDVQADRTNTPKRKHAA